MPEDASGFLLAATEPSLKGFQNWGRALSKMKRKCKGMWNVLDLNTCSPPASGNGFERRFASKVNRLKHFRQFTLLWGLQFTAPSYFSNIFLKPVSSDFLLF
jgi:hypothetical protein